MAATLHSFVDQTIENYMVEFIVPTIPTKTPLIHAWKRGFLKRARLSMSPVVITRNDAGTNTFNISKSLARALPPGSRTSTTHSPSAPSAIPASRWGPASVSMPNLPHS